MENELPNGECSAYIRQKLGLAFFSAVTCQTQFLFSFVIRFLSFSFMLPYFFLLTALKNSRHNSMSHVHEVPVIDVKN